MTLKGDFNYNSDFEEKSFELLKKHFRVSYREKYYRAMMSLLMQEAMEKVLGKNFKGERISQRAGERIRRYMIDRLHARYGPWINLTGFKLKKGEAITCSSNFGEIFDVDQLGILYGAISTGFYSDVFFTSHCFERFHERFESAQKHLKEGHTASDTMPKLLLFSLKKSLFEYGTMYKNNNRFIYINMYAGTIVLEDYQDFYVAKTFLASHMEVPGIRWYRPILSESQKKIGPSFMLFRHLTLAPCDCIDGPTFAPNKDI